MSGHKATSTVDFLSLVKESSHQQGFPRVAELTPYDLGATPSVYGGPATYGGKDVYVERTEGNFDSRLRGALRALPPMIIISGPSKSGKTRSLFEAVKTTLPDASVVTPFEGKLGALLQHEELRKIQGPTVIWLDDLERHLTTGGSVTWAAIVKAHQVQASNGGLLCVATIRQDQLAGLMGSYGDLDKETDLILRAASKLSLASTSLSPTETRAARRAYSGLDLQQFGLGEQLAGAPAILEKYIADKDYDVACWGVVAACVDWARLELKSSVSESDLLGLAALEIQNSEPTAWGMISEEDLRTAISKACQPHAASGKVSAIKLSIDRDGVRRYAPFDYLVSADNGDLHCSRRAVPESVLLYALNRFKAETDAQSLFLLSVSALKFGEDKFGKKAWTALKETGSGFAKNAYGIVDFTAGDFNGARQNWMEAAEEGDESAKFNLGLLAHQEGDDEKAASWWKEAAERLPLAATQLAILAEMRGDRNEATRWFEEAAGGGETSALVHLGAEAYEAGDRETAKQKFLEAASNGSDDAMHLLGVLADEVGERQAALDWWAEAAAAGNARAMSRLGWTRFKSGDHAGASELWGQAWKLGHVDAAFHLGRLAYQAGDLSIAQNWWEEAAERGDKDAMFNLAVLHHSAGAREESLPWLRRAAEGGHSQAMVTLGQVYKQENDTAAARIWWEKAITTGSSTAMLLLAVLLADSGMREESLRWFHKAKEAGEPDADLGESYLAAKAEMGGSNDEAVELWAQALDADRGHALFHLGSHAATAGDFDKARKLWQEATAWGSPEAHANLGGFAYSEKHFSAAFYHLLIAAEHGITEAYQYLAKVCEILGDIEGRDSWAARAASAQRDNPKHHHH